MLKRSKGFTLIELIIVIVIIGILAAVTIVGYSGQAAKARNNSAFTSLTEAVKAANICSANGDTVVAYAGDVALSVTTNKPICTSATSAVTGNWPTLSTAIGGTWKYINYAAGGPAGAVAVTNSVTNATPPVVNIAAAATAAVSPLATSGMPAVWCSVNGCSKAGF